MPVASNIIRVFPRRTSATPDDELAFVGEPPMFLPAGATEVHVSCVFTWDRPEAERLAASWRDRGFVDVRLGGPAYDAPAAPFTPGRYVKPGFTVTSRGCTRRCPFCFVPKREGALTLLPIQDGWDVLDNNLLACPRPHIEAVLAMLDRQSKAARFTGGIDSRFVESWFVERLSKMRLQILYTAFDMPQTWPRVERTIKMLADAGVGQRKIGCYVLVGFEGDTTDAAEERLHRVFAAGGMPFAMYFRGSAELHPKIAPAWRALVRRWSRPAAIFGKGANRPADSDTLTTDLFAGAAHRLEATARELRDAAEARRRGAAAIVGEAVGRVAP